MLTRSNGQAIDSSSSLLSPAFAAAAGAALLMLFASALFAVQAALVKVGLQEIGPLELVFFRGLVCVLVILSFARWRGQALATAHPVKQVALGIIGFASLALYFIALGMLPLVTATALCYTAPLFLALALGLHRARAARMAIVLFVAGGFLGVCLVLQPSLAGGSATGVLVGLLSGVTGAGAYLLLSRLGRAGEPERVTGLWFSLVVCLLAGVPTAVAGFSIATLQQVGLVVGIGLLATAAQLAVGRAYALSSPMIPATFSYSAVVFSSLLGAWWWGDQLGMLEMAGIALIVASGILVSAGQAGSDPRARCSAQPADEQRRQRQNRRHTLRSIYAAVMLARDPQQTQYVFMMGRAQDDIAEGERLRGRIRDPFAAEELERMWRAKFATGRYDVDALLRLPADTLGGAYARHMKANGLQPDYYAEVTPRHRLQFLRLRVHKTHDIWHVLCGFGTDEFGEVGLQGFYFAQFTNGQSAIIGAGAILKSVLRGRFGDLERHIDAFCEGYCNGKRARSLLAVKWEDLWSEPVEALRERYAISLPKLRPPLRIEADAAPAGTVTA